MNIFIDRSVIEFYINGKVISGRKKISFDNNKLEIYVDAGKIFIKELRLFQK